MSDLREAQAKGYISATPHYNSIFNYLESSAMTPVLRRLIEQSSLPLRSVETNFAVDSSGFTTSRFTRWFDVKYGKERVKQDWVKCHIMCGVKTNIVTAVEIEEMYTNDTLMFAPMVETTAKNFTVSRSLGGQGLRKPVEHRRRYQGRRYSVYRFQGSATGAAGGTFGQMFHYFMFKRDEFLAPLPSSLQCRIYFQHDEAEVRRRAAQQDRCCDGQRNAL